MNWLEKTATHKKMFIIRGPSGSGKSTISRGLAEKFNVPIFSTDDYWMKDGKYIFNSERLDEAHEWNRQRTEQAMSGGSSVVIVDNTNVKFWEMREYAILARKYGYNITFKEPNWSPELKTPDGNWNVDFLERIQQQKDRQSSGKIIPRFAIEKMNEEYEHNPTVESVLRSERPDELVR